MTLHFALEILAFLLACALIYGVYCMGFYAGCVETLAEQTLKEIRQLRVDSEHAVMDNTIDKYMQNMADIVTQQFGDINASLDLAKSRLEDYPPTTYQETVTANK